jgi:predicted nucleic acid-binding protein
LAVVLDANVFVALVVDHERGPVAEQLITRCVDAGEDLHAPELTTYEVASALTRLTTSRALDRGSVDGAWNALLALPVEYHPLREHGPRAVQIAGLLERQSAYDAAYLALAEEVGGELVTFDGRLVRNASRIGLPVRLAE